MIRFMTGSFAVVLIVFLAESVAYDAQTQCKLCSSCIWDNSRQICCWNNYWWCWDQKQWCHYSGDPICICPTSTSISDNPTIPTETATDSTILPPTETTTTTSGPTDATSPMPTASSISSPETADSSTGITSAASIAVAKSTSITSTDSTTAEGTAGVTSDASTSSTDVQSTASDISTTIYGPRISTTSQTASVTELLSSTSTISVQETSSTVPPTSSPTAAIAQTQTTSAISSSQRQILALISPPLHQINSQQPLTQLQPLQLEQVMLKFAVVTPAPALLTPTHIFAETGMASYASTTLADTHPTASTQISSTPDIATMISGPEILTTSHPSPETESASAMTISEQETSPSSSASTPTMSMQSTMSTAFPTSSPTGATSPIQTTSAISSSKTADSTTGIISTASIQLSATNAASSESTAIGTGVDVTSTSSTTMADIQSTATSQIAMPADTASATPGPSILPTSQTVSETQSATRTTTTTDHKTSPSSSASTPTGTPVPKSCGSQIFTKSDTCDISACSNLQLFGNFSVMSYVYKNRCYFMGIHLDTWKNHYTVCSDKRNIFDPTFDWGRLAEFDSRETYAAVMSSMSALLKQKSVTNGSMNGNLAAEINGDTMIWLGALATTTPASSLSSYCWQTNDCRPRSTVDFGNEQVNVIGEAQNYYCLAADLTTETFYADNCTHHHLRMCEFGCYSDSELDPPPAPCDDAATPGTPCAAGMCEVMQPSRTCEIDNCLKGMIDVFGGDWGAISARYIYNDKCYLLYNQDVHDTWENADSWCKNSKPLFDPHMEFARRAVFLDDETFVKVLTNLQQLAYGINVTNGTAMKTPLSNDSTDIMLWLGAEADSPGVRLSDYCWLTDTGQYGSQITAFESLVCDQDDTIGSGQYCLAANLSQPATLYRRSCFQSNYVICELGCGTIPNATCSNTPTEPQTVAGNECSGVCEIPQSNAPSCQTCNASISCQKLSIPGMITTFYNETSNICYALITDPVGISWTEAYDKCSSRDYTDLFRPPMEFGRMAQFSDASMMDVASQLQGENVSYPWIWIGAQAQSTGTTNLNGYCWMTNQTVAGSQITSASTAVVDLEIVSGGQNCLAIDINNPSTYYASPCSNYQVYGVICEFGCAPPAEAICTGNTYNMYQNCAPGICDVEPDTTTTSTSTTTITTMVPTTATNTMTSTDPSTVQSTEATSSSSSQSDSSSPAPPPNTPVEMTTPAIMELPSTTDLSTSQSTSSPASEQLPLTLASLQISPATLSSSPIQITSTGSQPAPPASATTEQGILSFTPTTMITGSSSDSTPMQMISQSESSISIANEAGSSLPSTLTTQAMAPGAMPQIPGPQSSISATTEEASTIIQPTSTLATAAPLIPVASSTISSQSISTESFASTKEMISDPPTEPGMGETAEINKILDLQSRFAETTESVISESTLDTTTPDSGETVPVAIERSMEMVFESPILQGSIDQIISILPDQTTLQISPDPQITTQQNIEESDTTKEFPGSYSETEMSTIEISTDASEVLETTNADKATESITTKIMDVGTIEGQIIDEGSITFATETSDLTTFESTVGKLSEVSTLATEIEVTSTQETTVQEEVHGSRRTLESQATIALSTQLTTAESITTQSLATSNAQIPSEVEMAIGESYGGTTTLESIADNQDTDWRVSPGNTMDGSQNDMMEDPSTIFQTRIRTTIEASTENMERTTKSFEEIRPTIMESIIVEPNVLISAEAPSSAEPMNKLITVNAETDIASEAKRIPTTTMMMVPEGSSQTNTLATAIVIEAMEANAVKFEPSTEPEDSGGDNDRKSAFLIDQSTTLDQDQEASADGLGKLIGMESSTTAAERSGDNGNRKGSTPLSDQTTPLETSTGVSADINTIALVITESDSTLIAEKMTTSELDDNDGWNKNSKSPSSTETIALITTGAISASIDKQTTTGASDDIEGKNENRKSTSPVEENQTTGIDLTTITNERQDAEDSKTNRQSTFPPLETKGTSLEIATTSEAEPTSTMELATTPKEASISQLPSTIQTTEEIDESTTPEQAEISTTSSIKLDDPTTISISSSSNPPPITHQEPEPPKTYGPISPGEADPCQWTEWSPCSVTCGEEGNFRVYRSRNAPNYTDLPCEAMNESKCCEIMKCIPMSDMERAASSGMMWISCVFILIGLGCSIASFCIVRNTDYLHVMQVMEDVSLFIAHLFVLFFSMRNDNKYSHTLCKISALCLQYFFCVTYSFQCLESFHIMTVLTNVVMENEIMIHLKYAIALGWGVPAVITGTTAYFAYDRLMSDYSCWININDKVFFATFLPVVCIAWLTVILLEAAGHWRPYLISDNVNSCKVARYGLCLILAAQFACWFLAFNATYWQHIGWFSIVFGFNIALGVLIFMNHFFSNRVVRTFIRNQYFRMIGRPVPVRVQNIPADAAANGQAANGDQANEGNPEAADHANEVPAPAAENLAAVVEEVRE